MTLRIEGVAFATLFFMQISAKNTTELRQKQVVPIRHKPAAESGTMPGKETI